VANPSFETWNQGGPTGWEARHATPEPVKAAPGKLCARLDCTGTSAKTASLAQQIRVSESGLYKLSFVARQDGDAPATAQIVWLDEHANPVQSDACVLEIPAVLPDRFTEFSTIAGPAPCGAQAARLTFTKHGAGFLAIDDVSISKL